MERPSLISDYHAEESTSEKPLLLIGAGGHARVVLNALRLSGAFRVVGALDNDTSRHGQFIETVPVLGGDESLSEFPPHQVNLIMGLAGFGENVVRWGLLHSLRAEGYRFQTVKHPSAVIAASASCDEGAQLLAGSIINPGAHIGRDAIVNSAALVEHDDSVGEGAHLAPRVSLGGGVTIGERAQLGLGAVVLQGLTVGAQAIVGAGSVVTRDVEPYTLVVGVPARYVRHVNQPP